MPTTDTAVVVAASFTTVDLLTIGVTALGVGGGRGPTVGTPRVAADRESDIVQPAMMTFKSFLATQDDGISDEDAIKKYSEYKLEFKRQQLNEFFVNHKDEEWWVSSDADSRKT